MLARVLLYVPLEDEGRAVAEEAAQEARASGEEMWLRRRAAAGSGPLFPSVGGGWLDQNNCNKRLRAALDGAGFDWVTSRMWRKRSVR